MNRHVRYSTLHLTLIALAAALMSSAPSALAANRRVGKTTGWVVAVGERSLELKAGGQVAEFAVGRRAKLAALEVSQLRPDETATVSCVQEEGQKFVKDVHAEGVLVGKATGLRDTWIEVAPPGGKAQRFRPRWIGGASRNGGGLGKLRIGMTVKFAWTMREGKRVAAVEPVQ